jgi:serine protease Do
VIKQLIKHGQVRRGWLGVHIQGVTEEIADTLGLTETKGALVASVIPDGPAEKAKLKAGDVILKFDGRDIGEMRHLPRIVADTEVGKAVPVEIWRNNAMVTLSVTIEELDDEVTKVATGPSGREKKAERTEETLGLHLSTLSSGLREKFQLEKDSNGVLVTKVKPDGLAAEKGIRKGDLIVEINRVEVSTPMQVVNKVAEAKKAGRKTVLLLVEGQGGLRFIGIRLPKS